MKCPYCQTEEKQVKAGLTTYGTQRYKCQKCKRKYSPEAKQPGYPNEVRMKAIQLYLEGIGFRGIGRILKVNYQSVINWVNAYTAQLPQADMPKEPKVGELDELFTYVGNKKTKSTS
jgi:transposase-like protein